MRSPIPLVAPVTEGTPDVEIVEGTRREIPFRRPSDQVVAERVVDGVCWYTFTRVGDTVVGRFFGLADFVVDDDLRRVEYHLEPGADAALVPVLFAGTVVAFLLMARGCLVLHASAVELDGKALAFMGFSGQGKTTVAALACTVGLRLVADDVLPVHVDEAGVWCVPGAIELRLRGRSLETAFGSDIRSRVTVDDRWAVRPEVVSAGRLELGWITVPVPDRECQQVAARRLGAAEATFEIIRYQRIEGWRSPVHVRAQLSLAAGVAAMVPVRTVRIPWGPPFPDDLVDQVIRSCTVDYR